MVVEKNVGWRINGDGASSNPVSSGWAWVLESGEANGVVLTFSGPLRDARTGQLGR